MAVSKELLARYKEMKAAGISITLAELKAQMEAEEKSSAANLQTQDNTQLQPNIENENNNYINNYNSPQNITTITETQSKTEQNNTIQNPASTQNNIYAEQYSNYSNNFNANYSNYMNTASTPESYSNSQNTNTPTQTTLQQNQMQETITNETSVIIPDTINAPTRKFAVIGYPLGHSLSGYMHDAGFKSLGLKASYEILETPPETLVDRIKFFKTHNYSGFNVTIPLKLPVIMFLDEVDESADLVNAVNTVSINPQTKELKGYNTDVIGFRNAIPEAFTLIGKTAGILGTGGAARAAITALAQSQMKEIKLYTRNIPNCLELLNYLRKTFPSVTFSAHQIERIRDLSDINLLVNTTPIGMLGRSADMTPVEENELRTLPQGALVYDVIYNPKKTVLLKLAEKYGYKTLNGVDMFIHQALAAEQIWTGRTPDFKDMKIAVLENL